MWLLVVMGCPAPPGLTPVDTDPDDTDAPSACTDLDCDGWPDLVVGNSSYDGPPTLVYWGGPERFADLRRSEIPEGTMTKSAALADLDLDGDVYLVLSWVVTLQDDPLTTSLVLYTTGLDPWTYEIVELPTSAAHQALVADFDADGWPDLFFANQWGEGFARSIDSFVYWGGPGGFSEADRSGIATRGAFGASACDADADGRLDLVISSYFDGVSRKIGSFVVWGDGERFATGSRLELPTIGARANLCEDLDRDGFLDVLFVNHYDDVTMDVPTYVYRGGERGFLPEEPLKIPNLGPHTATAADLDGEGWLDLVFSNQRSDPGWEGDPDSRIAWGDATGWSPDRITRFDTINAAGHTVGDLDRDGFLDIAFANFAHEQGASASYVFWGGPDGFSERTDLPTEGADAMVAFPGEPGF
jgi:hypothetical protein